MHLFQTKQPNTRRSASNMSETPSRCRSEMNAVCVDLNDTYNNDSLNERRGYRVRRALDKVPLPVGNVLIGARTSLYHTALIGYINKAAAKNSSKSSHPARSPYSYHNKIHRDAVLQQVKERPYQGNSKRQSPIEKPPKSPCDNGGDADPNTPDITCQSPMSATSYDHNLESNEAHVYISYTSCQNSVSTLGSGSERNLVETVSFQEDKKPFETKGLEKTRHPNVVDSGLLRPFGSCDPGRQLLKADCLSPCPASAVSIDPPMEIELFPGVHATLRGSKETWHAIQTNRAASVNCMCCELVLFCVRDADFVLCPDCRVVSPLYHSDDAEMKLPAKGSGGVGLGVNAHIPDDGW